MTSIRDGECSALLKVRSLSSLKHYVGLGFSKEIKVLKSLWNSK